MLAAVVRRRLSPSPSSVPIFLLSFARNASFPPHSIIKMPALSPTMTAGNVGPWHKKPGDSISPGEVLVEIETDKAQMDFEFQEDGVLARILKETGERDVAVGNPIAVMVEEGSDIAPFESFSLKDAGGESSPAKSPKKEQSDSDPVPAPPPAPEPEDTEISTGKKLQTALDREPNITASAKRLALEKKIDIQLVKGTGPGGKITDGDVQKSTSGQAVSTASLYDDIPISNMRKTIASRLKESTQNNPHFYITSSISVSKLLKLRQALNTAADGKYKLSLNDFMIKSMAVASRKVPAVNSSWREGVIRQFKSVDVSVAVATPSGLITPVVTGCEARGLESISAAVKELAKKARDNKLKPEEYQGGTISISNMGMNPAVHNFTAIINPPQAAILAVGTTQKVAIPTEAQGDGQPGIDWDDQVTVTASFDHKVVDGAIGAQWITELKKVIENPLELLL